MHRMLVRFVVVVGCYLAAIAITYADEIHKNPFSGKTTSLIKGEDNVKAEVKSHALSTDRSRSLPSSERIVLNLAAGKNEKNFAYYYYPTPAAPLVEDLTAEMWMHSSKAGVQMLARIVFPKIRNPKQIDESLTRIVLLDTYKAPAGGWQKLILKRPADILQAQKVALRLEMKGDPDISDAYIDRLILNLYTGPGEIEVFVDNLEIGPVKEGSLPPPIVPKGIPTVKPKDPIPDDRKVMVEFTRGDLTVGGEKIFPRFIRYSGTPMQALKLAGFNALAMSPDVPPEVLEDAIDNYQFWIVPQIPPISETNPERRDSPLTAQDPESLAAAIRKFRSGDGVLFWDLGAVRSEDYRRTSRTVEAIRAADPRRPVAADVWDGFGRFAIPLQLVGTHRDPLMTSLELDQYGRWLFQRKILASGSKFTWTWIQTHMPEWQVRLLYDQPAAGGIQDPIGPQPEQIRLLTYLAVANGCKGLGYWSDRFLADSHHGRDRLLQLALLNQEIEMLEPILLNLNGEVRWVTSSHPQVTVAIMRTTDKGVLAIPIWVGGGSQYVPPQGAIRGLTFTVPLVPDGAEPWELTPVRVQSLQANLKLTSEGTQVTLPEFDLTAAVVFTSDHAPDGLLAAWQKHTRRISRYAASWACDLAEEQFKKVMFIHEKLCAVAPPLDPQMVGALIHDAERRLLDAKKSRIANNDETAYFEAMRALRPLRVLMRAHWDQAVKTLDHPAATPYSVSYYTLPRHWELAHLLRACQIGENTLTNGDFDAARPLDGRGVAVTTLPNWTVQESAIDDVLMRARIVPGAEAKEEPPAAPTGRPPRYQPSDPDKRIVAPVNRQPGLGAGILKLSVSPRPVVLKKDEKAPPEPQALERVFLAVNSPPAHFTPGTWVRISGWMKVPGDIRASADGAMLFDTTTGEAYAIRLTATTEWKQFHVYRKVPASGEVRVRLALTGFGTVYFDDIRIEPFLASDVKQAGDVTVMPVKRER
jgi:hypothetical protein